MHVILDTNIFHQNRYLLDNHKFEALFGYLEKVKAKLIIPEIVFEEVMKHYRLELVRISNESMQLHKDIKSLVSCKDIENDHLVSIDIDLCVKRYRERLKLLQKCAKVMLLPIKNEYMPALVKRSLDEEKPFGSKDRGFRDALLWEAIKDYLSDSNTDMAFISSNEKDFGSDNKLHENLRQELGGHQGRLFYYSSLNKFLEEHVEKIGFITKELLGEFFNSADVVSRYEDGIDSSDIDIEDMDLCGIDYEYDESDIDVVSLDSIDVDSFYIYRYDGHCYYLIVELILNVDVEVSLTVGEYADGYCYPKSVTGSGSCYIYEEAEIAIYKDTYDIEIQ